MFLGYSTKTAILDDLLQNYPVFRDCGQTETPDGFYNWTKYHKLSSSTKVILAGLRQIRRPPPAPLFEQARGLINRGNRSGRLYN